MKIKAYTAIVGDFDKPRYDVKCFTDKMGFVLDVMNAKIYKALPHKFINADVSIWLDGNIYLNTEKEKVAELLGDYDMAVFKHPSRTNVYEEAEAIKYFYPSEFIKEQVDYQIACYKEAGVPTDIPMAECGMIIRQHNDIVQAFNEAWWAEICRFSFRDQLSFPVVASMFPTIRIKYLDDNVRTHEFFRYIPHL